MWVNYYANKRASAYKISNALELAFVFGSWRTKNTERLVRMWTFLPLTLYTSGFEGTERISCYN